MDTTYNAVQAKAVNLPTGVDKWSVLDLLVFTTLAMYVFLSVSPQQVGNCAQRVSYNITNGSVVSASV